MKTDPFFSVRMLISYSINLQIPKQKMVVEMQFNRYNNKECQYSTYRSVVSANTCTVYVTLGVSPLCV